MRKWVLLGLAVAAILVAVVIWRQWERTSGTIEIGVLLSLTGDVGPYGQRSLKGINLAKDEINSAGGIAGRPISLRVEDTRSSPRDAVSAYTKLVTLEHVRIIVGDVLSGTTLAIAPLAKKDKVVLLAPGASNPALRDAGDYVFRNWVSDDFDGTAMAQYIAKEGIRAIYILNQQTDYSVGLANAFKKAFEALGGKVVGQDAYVTETTDFRPHLLRMQRSGASSVFLTGEARQNGTILRQAREMGLEKQWFANLTIDTPEAKTVAGDAREGVVFTTPAFDPDESSPQTRQFVRAFRERYGEDPEVTSGIAYDAMKILAAVMTRTGSEPEQVKAGLYKVKDFPGVTGSTSFDDHGDVTKDIFIKVIKNGNPVLLTRFAVQQ
ncbi:MAG: penicillin-binding protein activator [Pseudomonadota bacterium]|nr:penicillin-binding protein activator [Pseudomonadota bacterium]